MQTVIFTVYELYAHLAIAAETQSFQKIRRRNQMFGPYTSKKGVLHYRIIDQLVRARRHNLRHMNLAIAFMRGHVYRRIEAKAETPMNVATFMAHIPLYWRKENDLYNQEVFKNAVQAWLVGVEPIKWPKPLPYRVWKERKPKQLPATTAPIA